MNSSEFKRRRAKIICTLGPSTDTYDKILRLADAGMNIARFNFSHGDRKQHKKRFDFVRKASEELGFPIAILQDLPGPKIRVGTFRFGSEEIISGQSFTLTPDDVEGTDMIAHVSYDNLHEDVKPEDIVLLDDGKLKLKVDRIEGRNVICTVIYGGVLRNNKGVNLPVSKLRISALTEDDREHLRFGLEMGVDYVALSFVQRPEHIVEAKEIIRECGHSTPVIAKIEKPRAVASIEKIVKVVDGIMIARGDLGVEMLTEEVPPIQKKIIALCNREGVPVITATQMLESMITSARPTRAEAADVANAVLDGSDAVMLSAETAAGNFPVEAVQTMAKVIALIETTDSPLMRIRERVEDREYSVPVAIGYSASNAAKLVDASAIICFTQSGSTAKMISRFRPKQNIIAVTPNKDAYFRSPLFWGVTSHHYTQDFPDNMDHAISEVIGQLRDKKMVRKGEKVVITAGIPFYRKDRGTNMLRIEEVS